MLLPDFEQVISVLREGVTLTRYQAPSSTGKRYFLGLSIYAVNQIHPSVGRKLVEEGFVVQYEWPDPTGNKEFFKLNEALLKKESKNEDKEKTSSCTGIDNSFVSTPKGR